MERQDIMPGTALAMSGSNLAPEHAEVRWRSEVDDLVDRLRHGRDELPYDPTPERLYRVDDLYLGLDDGFATTIDQQIYRRACTSDRRTVDPVEEMAQRLHDHGITLALTAFRENRSLVGVMGGHAMERGSDVFRAVVDLGVALRRAGYCVTTGGGPGAMEAANLGAAAAGAPAALVDEAVAILAEVPTFAEDPDAFIAAGMAARDRVLTDGPLGVSLAVPTWFYGHEPSNPFATHVAKYFSNSEREAGLLAIADAGIVYVPGGPGTFQEVFQDAAQNAYETFGPAAPMVFLDPPGQSGWWEQTSALRALDTVFVDHHGVDRPGRDLIRSVDDVAGVLAVLGRRRPD